MKHYPAVKNEQRIDTYPDMGKPWGRHAKWNTPHTKGQIVRDSIHMDHLKQANSLKQKVE